MRYAKMPDSSELSGGSGSEAEDNSGPVFSESESASSDSEDERERDRKINQLQEQLKEMQKQLTELQNAKKDSQTRKERRRRRRSTRSRRERLDRGAKNNHSKEESASFDAQMGAAGGSGLAVSAGGLGQFGGGAAAGGGYLPNDISLIGGNVATGKCI